MLDTESATSIAHRIRFDSFHNRVKANRKALKATEQELNEIGSLTIAS